MPISEVRKCSRLLTSVNSFIDIVWWVQVVQNICTVQYNSSKLFCKCILFHVLLTFTATLHQFQIFSLLAIGSVVQAGFHLSLHSFQVQPRAKKWEAWVTCSGNVTMVCAINGKNSTAVECTYYKRCTDRAGTFFHLYIETVHRSTAVVREENWNFFLITTVHMGAV